MHPKCEGSRVGHSGGRVIQIRGVLQARYGTCAFGVPADGRTARLRCRGGMSADFRVSLGCGSPLRGGFALHRRVSAGIASRLGVKRTMADITRVVVDWNLVHLAVGRIRPGGTVESMSARANRIPSALCSLRLHRGAFRRPDPTADIAGQVVEDGQARQMPCARGDGVAHESGDASSNCGRAGDGTAASRATCLNISSAR